MDPVGREMRRGDSGLCVVFVTPVWLEELARVSEMVTKESVGPARGVVSGSRANEID